MIKGSLGPITPFAPREITRRSDFGLGKAPLPEIRSLPRRKSAAEEIERLRSRLGWKTRPSRSGKEDEEEKGNETSDAIKLAKKIVDKDGRRPDDGEFVTCIAESRSNPYELNVVSTEKAKACGTYYTITATAVTRVTKLFNQSIFLSRLFFFRRRVPVKRRIWCHLCGGCGKRTSSRS